MRRISIVLAGDPSIMAGDIAAGNQFGRQSDMFRLGVRRDACYPWDLGGK